ncbi:MAG: glycosyltransferase family 2 protein [Acidobacteriaceae bacterium]|nr:glycosyltransferase family 2 protein [Acidobacteriaceae bacterium]MBV9295571.1 glycosyltransferase family 2 protein [Acidobacteriaceae bacterium]MBV9763992.1 glycosyltransferase family 2 protein [Acidobacteriaceae bacterium]
MATVSAIIPTWNRADLLTSILTNLSAQTRRPDQVIVVDNGSTDETQLVAREFRADISVFPENRGFATAVNEGIQRSNGDWLLILNNDVVLEPEWLERLLASAEQERASFAVGKLLRPHDRRLIDGSWDLVSRAAYAWRCGYGRPDGAVWSTKRKISFAPMTAALFKRGVFDQIGLLETRFESYYEDVDFGVRCALAGLQGIYEPAAIAMHMSKTTLGKSSYRVMFLTARNQILILAKYYSRETLLRFAWPILIGQILALMAAAKQGHPLAGLLGKWAGLRKWSCFRGQVSGVPHRHDLIEAIFRDSERQIQALQKQLGFDIYWRLYFSLVRA